MLPDQEGQAGAQDATYENPDCEVLQDFFADSLARGPARCGPRAHDEGKEKHQTKAVNRNAVRKPAGNSEGDSKEDLLHRTLAFVTGGFGGTDRNVCPTSPSRLHDHNC